MKKLLVGFCFACGVLSSQASYLWWTVNSSEVGDISSYAGTELKLSSDQVMGRVVAVNEQGETVGTSSETIPFTDPWYVSRTSVDLSAFGANYQSYSYYVEFVNASTSQVVGYNSEATTYANLASSVTTTLSDIPTVTTVWHGGSGTYKATPEPTSAMLMLLGVAGLALRRKQRKLA